MALEKASDIFKRMDAYWDSDQSFVDEFKHLETAHLRRLRDLDERCLAKLNEVLDAGIDPAVYWQWRVDNGMIDPHRCKPLAEIKPMVERHLRCAIKALELRGEE